MNADEILYFKEGRIVARGRHDELMAAFADYAQLVRLQFLERRPRYPAETAAAAQGMEAREIALEDRGG
jgi:hypothetical protein